MDRYLCGPAPSIGMAISIWRCAPTSPPRCWCSWASATEHSGHRSLSPPAASATLSPWAISTRTARPTLSRRPPIVSLCSSITAPTDGRSGRVDLNFRHRLVFGFVEGRERGFGRAESGEVRFGFFKSPVIGEGRAVAPGFFVSFGGGLDGGGDVAGVSLDLGEDVQGIGVEYGIRAALGEFPDLVEQFARGGGVALAAMQFGQRGQSWDLFFDAVNRAGGGQGLVQAFVGERQVAQRQTCFALQARCADEVALVASSVGQFPGTVGLPLGRRIAQP